MTAAGAGAGAGAGAARRLAIALAVGAVGVRRVGAVGVGHLALLLLGRGDGGVVFRILLGLLRGLAGLRNLLRRLHFLALALAGLVHGLLLDLLAALLHHLLHDVCTIGVAAASRFRVGRGRPVGVSRVLLQSLPRKDVAVSTRVCDGTRKDR